MAHALHSAPGISPELSAPKQHSFYGKKSCIYGKNPGWWCLLCIPDKVCQSNPSAEAREKGALNKKGAHIQLQGPLEILTAGNSHSS